MGRRTRRAAAPRDRGWRWRWPLIGALVILGIGAAAVTWWPSDLATMSSRPPRLLVDRTDIDLGYRRFDSPTRAVFTLTNAGTGPMPFAMGHGTGYSVELKGPQDEVGTFHVNPWGNVMPFGPPGRRTG